jgi:hypothetical protein
MARHAWRQMTAETGAEASRMFDNRLWLVYVAGIALNVVALSIAAMAGEWLVTVTFGVIISYLCLRFWMTTRS